MAVVGHGVDQAELEIAKKELDCTRTFLVGLKDGLTPGQMTTRLKRVIARIDAAHGELNETLYDMKESDERTSEHSDN